MPLTYVIDKSRRIVISTGSGILTGSEALEHRKMLREDPDFDPSFCQLIDLTAITSMSMDAQVVRQMGAVNIFNPESRRAAVASSDLAVGLMRMITTYGDISGQYRRTRLFRERDEALEWLFHA
jgi:hypothetical protein